MTALFSDIYMYLSLKRFKTPLSMIIVFIVLQVHKTVLANTTSNRKSCSHVLLASVRFAVTRKASYLGIL